jgi:hypothetical protein
MTEIEAAADALPKEQNDKIDSAEIPGPPKDRPE